MFKAFLYIICFYFFLPVNLVAQELVYNGDFEVYDTCPDFISQLSRAKGWISPNLATSDFFHTCSPSMSNGVPNNQFGYQHPYSGNGYAGFYVYSQNINYREYIQTKLLWPMVAGNNYEVSFYISLADRSEFASSQIGVYFSKTQITDYTSEKAFFADPQFENPIGVFLTDTSGWKLFKVLYLASGGEQYLTIGNFNDSLNNDTASVMPTVSNGPHSYYYLDGISVNSMSFPYELPNIITPNNDGLNESFSFNNFGLREVHCVIYNRWGNCVYEINNTMEAWIGKNKVNQDCSNGVYYYILEAKTEENRNIKQKGFIQLVR